MRFMLCKKPTSNLYYNIPLLSLALCPASPRSFSPYPMLPRSFTLSAPVSNAIATYTISHRSFTLWSLLAFATLLSRYRVAPPPYPSNPILMTFHTMVYELSISRRIAQLIMIIRMRIKSLHTTYICADILYCLMLTSSMYDWDGSDWCNVGS